MIINEDSNVKLWKMQATHHIFVIVPFATQSSNFQHYKSAIRQNSDMHNLPPLNIGILIYAHMQHSFLCFVIHVQVHMLQPVAYECYHVASKMIYKQHFLGFSRNTADIVLSIDVKIELGK